MDQHTTIANSKTTVLQTQDVSTAWNKFLADGCADKAGAFMHFKGPNAGMAALRNNVDGSLPKIFQKWYIKHAPKSIEATRLAREQ